jgi:murein DD-endopeptidase MepM/ murein hydrolase activator NlpD
MRKNFKALFFGVLAVFFFALTACGGGSGSGGSGTCNWTQRTSGTTNILYGVAFGNNTFVAVGFSGTVITSSNNGVNWGPGNSGTTQTLLAVVYGNNMFVAVGDEWHYNYFH